MQDAAWIFISFLSWRLCDSQTLLGFTGMEMVIMHLFISSACGWGSPCTNWGDFNSTGPFCVCSNELLPWLGKLLVSLLCFCNSLLKSLALNCIPWGPHALSIHSLSCPSY